MWKRKNVYLLLKGALGLDSLSTCLSYVSQENTFLLLKAVTKPNSDPLTRHRKANVLISGCGEGKSSVNCRIPSKESTQLMLKTSDGFQESIFKGQVRQGSRRVYDWLVVKYGTVSHGLQYQSLRPSRSGGHMLIIIT